ncbi:hypothetical protein BDW60DRAFT_183138 [Aspergillus nidulans var. acristatus]
MLLFLKHLITTSLQPSVVYHGYTCYPQYARQYALLPYPSHIRSIILYTYYVPCPTASQPRRLSVSFSCPVGRLNRVQLMASRVTPARQRRAAHKVDS